MAIWSSRQSRALSSSLLHIATLHEDFCKRNPASMLIVMAHAYLLQEIPKYCPKKRRQGRHRQAERGGECPKMQVREPNWFMNWTELLSARTSARRASFDVSRFGVLRLGGAFLFHTDGRIRSAGQACQFLGEGLPISPRGSTEIKGWCQVPALHRNIATSKHASEWARRSVFPQNELIFCTVLLSDRHVIIAGDACRKSVGDAA